MTRAIPVTDYEDLTSAKRKPALPAALGSWVQVAPPRAVALYGYGRPSAAVRDAALGLSEAGLVHLVQKRGKAGNWLYLAIKAGGAA